MAKKALKLEEEKVKKNSLVNTPSRSGISQVQDLSANMVVDAVESQGQLFSSEGQALELLVGSIVDKLSDGSKDKAEMADFLNLLIDTDPRLREEILAGVTIRKDS